MIDENRDFNPSTAGAIELSRQVQQAPTIAIDIFPHFNCAATGAEHIDPVAEVRKLEVRPAHI